MYIAFASIKSWYDDHPFHAHQHWHRESCYFQAFAKARERTRGEFFLTREGANSRLGANWAEASFLKLAEAPTSRQGTSLRLRSGGARFILAPRHKLFCRRKNSFKNSLWRRFCPGLPNFYWYIHTGYQNRKNLPNGHRMLRMFIKYQKCP
jgi:hypothetical protein